jgi:hypothetical protein
MQPNGRTQKLRPVRRLADRSADLPILPIGRNIDIKTFCDRILPCVGNMIMRNDICPILYRCMYESMELLPRDSIMYHVCGDTDRCLRRFQGGRGNGVDLVLDVVLKPCEF